MCGGIGEGVCGDGLWWGRDVHVYMVEVRCVGVGVGV